MSETGFGYISRLATSDHILESRLGEASIAMLPSHIRKRLDALGFRITRQRARIGTLLFGGPNRHVTAEQLHKEITKIDHGVSLATVYNALNTFTEIGLLRRIAVNGRQCYFDTNNSEHQHFHFEAEDRIVDIPSQGIRFGRLPAPPAGYEIVTVDTLVRLRKIAR